MSILGSAHPHSLVSGVWYVLYRSSSSIIISRFTVSPVVPK